MWDNVRYKTFSIFAKFDDDFDEKMQMELIELGSKYRRSIYIRFWEGALIAKFFAYPETMKQFRACFFDVLSLLNQMEKQRNCESLTDDSGRYIRDRSVPIIYSIRHTNHPRRKRTCYMEHVYFYSGFHDSNPGYCVRSILW